MLFIRLRKISVSPYARRLFVIILCAISLIACNKKDGKRADGLTTDSLEIVTYITTTTDETNIVVRFKHEEFGEKHLNTTFLGDDDRVYVYADEVRYKLDEVSERPLFPYTTDEVYSYESVLPPFPGGTVIRIAAMRKSEADATSTTVTIPPDPVFIQPLIGVAMSQASDIHLAWVKGETGDITRINMNCTLNVPHIQSYYSKELNFTENDIDPGQHLIPSNTLNVTNDGCSFFINISRYRAGSIDEIFKSGRISIKRKERHSFFVTP